jgi:hypothetical protein
MAMRRAIAVTVALAVGVSGAVLPASVASASTLDVADPTGDVYVRKGVPATSDSGTDITALQVDHGPSVLTVIARLASITSEGVFSTALLIDTTGDGAKDFSLTYSFGDTYFSGASCDSAQIAVTKGANGMIAFTVPRSCLDYPRAVRVGVVASRGDSLLTKVQWDLAPGADVQGFTAPVASEGVSKVRPTVRMRVKAGKHRLGKKPVQVVVSMSNAANGTVRLYDENEHRLATGKIANGRALVKVSTRRLKKGTSWLYARFTPRTPDLLAAASADVKVKVLDKKKPKKKSRRG